MKKLIGLFDSSIYIHGTNNLKSTVQESQCPTSQRQSLRQELTINWRGECYLLSINVHNTARRQINEPGRQQCHCIQTQATHTNYTATLYMECRWQDIRHPVLTQISAKLMEFLREICPDDLGKSINREITTVWQSINTYNLFPGANGQEVIIIKNHNQPHWSQLWGSPCLCIYIYIYIYNIIYDCASQLTATYACIIMNCRKYITSNNVCVSNVSRGKRMEGTSQCESWLLKQLNIITYLVTY